MEYQKIINLIGNMSNQPSKFRTKNWVEINGDRRGKYDQKNLTFKTTMLNASLYDHSDAYILAEERITVVGEGADAAAITADRNNKQVVFRNFAPFIKYISKISRQC